MLFWNFELPNHYQENKWQRKKNTMLGENLLLSIKYAQKTKFRNSVREIVNKLFFKLSSFFKNQNTSSTRAEIRKLSIPWLTSWNGPKDSIAPLYSSHSKSKLFLQILWQPLLVFEPKSHIQAYSFKVEKVNKNHPTKHSDQMHKNLCFQILILHFPTPKSNF